MPYARRDTVQWHAGMYYHLYNRGAHRQPIFREETNYYFVLKRIKKYCKLFNLTMIAYCLMPNHYHFLVRQNGEDRAGLLPQRVFNSYTKAYNKKYNHSGTLFQGNFEAKHVDNDDYLLHLCRYIHANPVKDRVVKHCADWLYSNYLEWVGLRNGTLVDRQFVAEMFPRAGQYEAFVQDYLLWLEENDEDVLW